MSSKTPQPLPPLTEQVQQALTEDVQDGDLSAALLPNHSVHAVILSRESGILCGAPWAEEVFRQLDPTLHIHWQVHDGQALQANGIICTLHGSVRAILSGERTALNFLQTLSATATRSHLFCQQIAHTSCRLLDTRKTLPGWRLAQKYAVRCGGGVNHRMGLYDAIMLKENHLMAFGSVKKAIAHAQQQHPTMPLISEVETLEQFTDALNAGPDQILLDNFTLNQLQHAVQQGRQHARPVTLEASGGITLKNIRQVAETGVDYISVGTLTKDIQAVDLSLLIQPK